MLSSVVESNVTSRKGVIVPQKTKKLFSYITIPNDKTEIKQYNKIYSIHKYWSRKPWYPIAECINKQGESENICLCTT